MKRSHALLVIVIFLVVVLFLNMQYSPATGVKVILRYRDGTETTKEVLSPLFSLSTPSVVRIPENVEMIRFLITVKNTGNVGATFTVNTSGQLNLTMSETSAFIEPGESHEFNTELIDVSQIPPNVEVYQKFTVYALSEKHEKHGEATVTLIRESSEWSEDVTLYWTGDYKIAGESDWRNDWGDRMPEAYKNNVDVVIEKDYYIDFTDECFDGYIRRKEHRGPSKIDNKESWRLDSWCSFEYRFAELIATIKWPVKGEQQRLKSVEFACSGSGGAGRCQTVYAWDYANEEWVKLGYGGWDKSNYWVKNGDFGKCDNGICEFRVKLEGVGDGCAAGKVAEVYVRKIVYNYK